MKKRMDRRHFLKHTACAAAVPTIISAAVPTIISSTALGKGDTPAPSNRINVGMIGCGNISNYHTNYLKRMQDVRVIAVCDAYRSRRLARAADFNSRMTIFVKCWHVRMSMR